MVATVLPKRVRSEPSFFLTADVVRHVNDRTPEQNFTMMKLTVQLGDIVHTEEKGRLTGTLQIGNASFHVEAIQVQAEFSGIAVDPELQARIEGIQHFDDFSDGYDTVLYRGAHYFLLIHPFQT